LPHTDAADEIAKMEPKFFTAVQMATLIRLCDVLLPPIGDRPGALQAETPFFLDFLIGGSPDARKKIYTGGLNWLDVESQKRYGKAFAKIEEDQAATILKPWLRTWMSDHPPTEPHADFVNIAHEDIRTATVNSKAWNDTALSGGRSAADGLYWHPIEPDIYGRNSDHTRASGSAIAVPKSAQAIPVYSR
jgi:hypothetical protein